MLILQFVGVLEVGVAEGQPMPKRVRIRQKLWCATGSIESLEVRRLLAVAPVADINPTTNSSSPDDFVTFGGSLFFTATTGQAATGQGVFKYDPGTGLISQIAAVPARSLFVAGSKLYFTADDSQGAELWSSDGTAVGTARLIDINTGPGSSDPTPLGNLAGNLIFAATTSATGTELYISNGTAGGTTLLKDIYASTNSSSPAGAIVVGSTLYFAATDATGTELWKTNGTGAGTVQVKDINPGAASGLESDTRFAALGSNIYFNANDGTNGWEFWKSDGTSPNTTLLKDTRSGPLPSSAIPMGVVGTKIILQVFDGTDYKLWSSDGTGANTLAIAPTINLPSVDGAVLGSYFYFGATVSGSGELWRTDGTSGATTLVKSVAPGSSSALLGPFVTVGSTIYFHALGDSNAQELWRTDGTGGGTVFLNNSEIGPLSAIGTTVYFRNVTVASGAELWKITGLGPASMVSDLNSSTAPSIPDSAAVMNGVRYFFADNGTNGRELWRSDEATGATSMVKDIALGIESSAYQGLYSEIGVFNNKLYFAAFDGTDYSLWTSDGTSVGTTNLSTTALLPRQFTIMGGELYFAITDPLGTASVAKTNGTTVTVLSSATLNNGVDPFLTALGSRVYFSDASGQLRYVTTSGQTIVTAAGGLEVRNLCAFGGKLYFGARATGPDTQNFYVYDPVANTVSMLEAGVDVARVEAVNGAVWFVGNNTVYKSDGTIAGTNPLSASNPTIDFSTNWKTAGPGTNSLFHVQNGIVYFQASDVVNGQQLWRSDGTSGGTTRVTSFAVGDANSRFLRDAYDTPQLRAFAGKIYFFLLDSASAAHLYYSDGTGAGTAQVSSSDLQNGGYAHLHGGGFLGAPSSTQMWFTYETTDKGVEPYRFIAPIATTTGAYQLLSGNITLGATGSSSPMGNTLSYTWDLDNDGVFGETGGGATRGIETGISPTFIGGSTPSVFNVSVRVSDTLGMTTTAATTVTVGPLAGVSFAPGAGYTLYAIGTPAPNLTFVNGLATVSVDLGSSFPGLTLNLPTGGEALFNTSQKYASLNMTGGDATLAANGNRALALQSLTISTNSVLDLNDNDLIVNYSSVSPIGTWNGSAYTQLTGWVAQGRNGGNWDGATGIKSSLAASSGYTTLGIAEASDALGLSGAQTQLWTGSQTVDATSVLVKFTYGGDANLSGNVDIDDYGQIDFNASTGGFFTGFFNGDFDYSGIQDVDDYGLIDFVIAIQGPPL